MPERCPTIVQVTPAAEGKCKTVAICVGSGGSLLSGKQADVYLTGEMSHVGDLTYRVVVTHAVPIVQHEVLAAAAAGKHVILCKYRAWPRYDAH